MSGCGAVLGEEEFIAALDVGTTTVKCLIFDKAARVRGQEATPIRIEYPKPRWVEMDPDALWDNVVYVLRGAIQDAGISPGKLRCMSITTQRSSFLFWDANNNTPITKIISWKDLRATELVRRWNTCLYIRSFRLLCKFLYSITKNKRYLSGSVLRVMNELVVIRLLWVLENVPGIREKIALNQVKFGTLDTFIIHKLTNGEKHVTDFSNACVSGFFDPFVLSYAEWALKMYRIPSSILPKTAFWKLSNIPWFRSSNLGLSCGPICLHVRVGGWGKGAVKVTLGTGAFLDVNTGTRPHSGVGGIYPLVGWKYGAEIAYIAEGQSKDNGNLVEWGRTIGLYNSVAESSTVAESVEDTNDAYFIPAFSGLQAPYNDMTATSGFFGMSPTTTKAHLARALLESLAFRVAQLLNILQREASDIEFDHIKVDGGVANNDFVLQTIADLTGKPVIRPVCRDMTALGCAFMAGVNCGFWSSREDLLQFYRVERIFHGVEDGVRIQVRFAEWERALERFLKWREIKEPS
ncbi:putative glycerol kinase 5 [Folsomia candida]|uniref:Glycerol kinase 5 n=1 Tax=Folsomia candida TaxID=158441 RepID=A0A226DUV3_FOLCA|nr:putative glycerol kinase 5 [Folsomia candida]